MTLAFLPSVVVVGLVALAAGPARGRRLVGLAVARWRALVVAGPGTYRNGEAVLDYLTVLRLRQRAHRRTASDQSLLSLESWRQTARLRACDTPALPMVLLWLVGLAVLVWALVEVWRRRGPRSALAAGWPARR